MGMLTQFITSTQFYLFGRSRFTQTGWHKAAKKYVQGELDECKLQGKCYAVTGANSGIGRETAGFLASRGARVLMLCRSKERAEKAKNEMKPDNGGSLEVIVADVSLVSSVTAAAKQVRATTSKLDGLVCCAGVLLNEKTMTSEGVEATFASHLAFGS